MARDQQDPEQRLREETDRAAGEARAIGGKPSPDEAAQDPAQAPVQQAGGGYAEGFEQAEDDLIENASHGTHNAEDAVLDDEFTGEVEADRSDAEYGEADRERTSEDEDRDY